MHQKALNLNLKILKLCLLLFDFQYIFEVRIDDTKMNEYIGNNSAIIELKNVKVLARPTAFKPPPDIRIRNLFYKSGKPGELIAAKFIGENMIFLNDIRSGIRPNE